MDMPLLAADITGIPRGFHLEGKYTGAAVDPRSGMAVNVNGGNAAARTPNSTFGPSCPTGLKGHVWAKTVATRVGLGLHREELY
jgi:hypothetical protein